MVLLLIVYLAFISLGLPDSLIGSAWPVMHADLGVPVSYAGIITMIIAGGTILSSLFSDRLIRRFGTGMITAVSILSTAAALFGFSLSGSFLSLCLWAVPYGLGAGAVDAALNNYVAVHFVSRHTNWLHCFWGVGASISPYIMSYCLTGGYGWSAGYRSVSLIQITLTAILFISLPLWKDKRPETVTEEPLKKAPGFMEILNIRGVPLILITFFGYCALEQTAMLWASSYFVQYRGIASETAARFASFFFLGMTAGRFLCGFIAERLGDKNLIRPDLPAMAGLAVIGLGCAPVYPCIIHSTPYRFGTQHSQAIIGVQMASAYIGTSFMPPLFGLIASNIGIGLFPFYLLFFCILTMIMSERLNRLIPLRKTVHNK